MILGGWNDYAILGFDVLALVRGDRAGHSFCLNSRQNMGETIWPRNLGGESESANRQTLIGSYYRLVKNVSYSYLILYGGFLQRLYRTLHSINYALLSTNLTPQVKYSKGLYIGSPL
jgi:hypothetical protein